MLAAAALLAAGCGAELEALIDSFPIALTRAPLGGTADGTTPGPYALASPAAGRRGAALPDDRGHRRPVTFWTETPSGNCDRAPSTSSTRHLPVDDGPCEPLSRPRAAAAPLSRAGDGSATPGGVLGGDLLRGYSVAFRFGAPCTRRRTGFCSSMTFWPHLGADDGFLEDAGYAVIRFSP